MAPHRLGRAPSLVACAVGAQPRRATAGERTPRREQVQALWMQMPRRKQASCGASGTGGRRGLRCE
ncbi:hypothetical protein BDA96_03G479000 [Sorghum bicolor]|uniref:Uncharacterized protein n=2 Tax=Sorghum bicolor TaxID=4558 RepID=A0A1B6Q8J2_SORBI|nr:hypothetical protein BDA96_03G479000 [Sorghum bicolor]KXG34232.1 hypothetical protein SORBI_3003G446000 [Sorghum bicolor]KXG34233.1 hypothetical protein SORBI_3003G446000 [Sorghum bicolor]